MNWYARLKVAFVRLAAPYPTVKCPECGVAFMTDLLWERAGRASYRVVGHDGQQMTREQFRAAPHLARYERSVERIACPHCRAARDYQFTRPVGTLVPECEVVGGGAGESFVMPQRPDPVVVPA
jgi:hypothetical protein